MTAQKTCAGDKPRFRENYRAQQSRQEEAGAAAAERRHRPRLHAKSARNGADHPVDRGSLLRGAGKVDASQKQRCFEPALPEDLGQELVKRGAEEGELLGKGQYEGAARDIGLLLQTSDYPRR